MHIGYCFPPFLTERLGIASGRRTLYWANRFYPICRQLFKLPGYSLFIQGICLPPPKWYFSPIGIIRGPELLQQFIVIKIIRLRVAFYRVFSFEVAKENPIIRISSARNFTLYFMLRVIFYLKNCNSSSAMS